MSKGRIMARTLVMGTAFTFLMLNNNLTGQAPARNYPGLAGAKKVPPKSSPKKVPPSPKPKAALPAPSLSLDQARMIVKDIPTVDIRSTLGRWKPEEAELVKLRQWSAMLAEDPGRTDFLPKWSEWIAQVSSRNRQLQDADVAPLIQMLMSAAYEAAHKDLDSYSQRVKFYKEMKEQIQNQLTGASQMQALLRSQQTDPLAGSLLPLSSNQRTLRKCQQSGESLRLDCKETLISTNYELEDYLQNSEAQIKKAEAEVVRAEAELQSRQERRRQTLYALSDTAKMMYDSAAIALRKNG